MAEQLDETDTSIDVERGEFNAVINKLNDLTELINNHIVKYKTLTGTNIELVTNKLRNANAILKSKK